mmetsp:Transcript_27616/g.66506  ORF Transcript_27616/g.66506 Transcript_27616/m.66506 type:complete len:253 (+) Transcript_27616:1481-2239(+)
MPSLERQQRVLDVVRTVLALQDVAWDLGEAVRQAVHRAPEELARGRGHDAVYTLQPTVTDVDVLALPAAGLTILLGEAADDELLHHVEEVVREEVGVGPIDEGLADVRVGRRGQGHRDRSLGQEVGRGPVGDVVGTTSLGGDLGRGRLPFVGLVGGRRGGVRFADAARRDGHRGLHGHMLMVRVHAHDAPRSSGHVYHLRGIPPGQVVLLVRVVLVVGLLDLVRMRRPAARGIVPLISSSLGASSRRCHHGN